MLYSNSKSFAQGCSDPGFCSVGNFKPLTENLDTHKNYISTGFLYGQADLQISVLNAYVEYVHFINQAFNLTIKISSQLIGGYNITSYGLSDIFISSTSKILSKVEFTGGLKIPLGDGNKMWLGKPLPMVFQPSLGTVDIFAGIKYITSRFQLMIGFQQPLTQNNNSFLASMYPDTSALSLLPSTNGYIRRGDLIIRMSFPIKIIPNIQIVPSLLPIYHVADDLYTNEMGIQEKISGSKGVTLNWNIFVNYTFKSKHLIQLSLAAPLIVRKVRPDGLTRHFLIGIEYRNLFN